LYSPDSIKILKPAEDIPLSAYVGTLGMAGMTAYLGLTKWVSIFHRTPSDEELFTHRYGAILMQGEMKKVCKP